MQNDKFLGYCKGGSAKLEVTSERHVLQFLCGLCRQIRGTSNLLQEIISSQGYEDQDLVEGLLEHLADVNEIPNAIDNPEICFAWGYRLLMRAYALQIACG